MYILTIRFKKGTQEIRFKGSPNIQVKNNRQGCRVFVDGKPYVKFILPCEGWGWLPYTVYRFQGEREKGW